MKFEKVEFADLEIGDLFKIPTREIIYQVESNETDNDGNGFLLCSSSDGRKGICFSGGLGEYNRLKRLGGAGIDALAARNVELNHELEQARARLVELQKKWEAKRLEEQAESCCGACHGESCL